MSKERTTRWLKTSSKTDRMSVAADAKEGTELNGTRSEIPWIPYCLKDY